MDNNNNNNNDDVIIINICTFNYGINLCLVSFVTQYTLSQSESTLKRMFVLPDFQKIMKGYIKSPDSLTLENEQILTLETERFSVPEVLRLFN